MTIKRIEHTGTTVDAGDVLDARGNPIGRGRLTRKNYGKVLDVGTHQEPGAEVRGGVQHVRALIEFDDPRGKGAAVTALMNNDSMTIRLDTGETVQFQVLSDTTGQINITKTK